MQFHRKRGRLRRAKQRAHGSPGRVLLTWSFSRSPPAPRGEGGKTGTKGRKCTRVSVPRARPASPRPDGTGHAASHSWRRGGLSRPLRTCPSPPSTRSPVPEGGPPVLSSSLELHRHKPRPLLHAPSNLRLLPRGGATPCPLPRSVLFPPVPAVSGPPT